MPVNTTGWRKLPIADRETKFAFRAATDRLAAKAKSIEEFNSWFFWRNPAKPANNRNSYRMPFADVFDDGQVRLVPAAVFSAAAQLSGAHGQLSIPEPERDQIRKVIEQIYAEFRNMWDDPRQVVPWERPSNSVADEPVKAAIGQEEEMPVVLYSDYEEEIVAAVNSAGWGSYPIASPDREWDSGAARARLKAWAGEDMGKYRKAFLWYDAQNAENVTAYKFPIADIIDGTLTIVPRAVNNADARLSSADIPAADKSRIQAILDRIQQRFDDDRDDDDDEDEDQMRASVTAADSVVPVNPPAAWFEDPHLAAPTRIRVTPQGQVYGHLAQWNTCHRGIGNSCVLAPRSATNYAHFKTGTTLTADGILLPVGNLTFGGGHADTSLGYLAAAAHYDDAGTAVAQVNVGEDAFGIWVAGSMAPGTGEIDAQNLRSHPLSGDWRRTGGNLELIAALAVNTPGFPIEEPQFALNASGEQNSLIAAGVVLEDATDNNATDFAKAQERVTALEAKAAQLRQAVDRRRARTIIDVKLPEGV